MNKFFSVAAAAEQLGVSEDFIWGLIRQGQLRAVRLGRRIVRIDGDELERFARGGLQKPAAVSLDPDDQVVGGSVGTRRKRHARRT